ncbi:MAG: thiamine-phosphate kinase [Methanomicrobiales archaeon]|jgi:thiamine-monophosphate kinase|nr:thiamine-phosphate kinase [Methanomicrobiales archaeon]
MRKDERALISQIASIIGERCDDDCAIIPSPFFSLDSPSGSSKDLVVSTDMLHETTDFPKGMSDWQIGWMSAAVTLSDLAAMGSLPLYLLLAIGADDPSRVKDIVRGAYECCMRYGVRYIGGDLDTHRECTVVSTGIGEVACGCAVQRSGAGIGDRIGIVGIPGRAEAGLFGCFEFLIHLLEPQPRVAEGQALLRAGATAMMDISDGLMISLFDLAKASSVCCMIDLDAIPVFSSNSLSQEQCRDFAWYGGGDFGLLFTIPPSHIEKIEGIDTDEIFLIGEVCAGEGVVSSLGSLIPIRGYSHF